MKAGTFPPGACAICSLLGSVSSKGFFGIFLGAVQQRVAEVGVHADFYLFAQLGHCATLVGVINEAVSMFCCDTLILFAGRHANGSGHKGQNE